MIVNRKKPQIIEAIQHDGTNETLSKIRNLRGKKDAVQTVFSSLYIDMKKVDVGDWVIREGNHVFSVSAAEFEILFEREKNEKQ